MKNIASTLFLIAILFSVKVSNAQFSETDQPKIDSLKTIINSPDSKDTSRINALVEFGIATRLFRIGYWDSIVTDCQKIIGSHPSDAVELNLNNSLAASLNSLGFIYNNQGQITKALEYFHKSMTICEKVGNKGEIASNLINLGYIYKVQGDTVKALEYYHKSLKTYDEIGSKEGVAYNLHNIGVIYNNQGEFSEAMEYYQKSMKIREETGDKRGFANSMHSIGILFETQGDTAEALEYLYKSLSIYEECNDTRNVAHLLSSIAKVLLGNGQVEEAKSHAIRAMELSQQLGFPDNIRNIADILSKIYAKENKGMLALEMYQLHIVMRDSINNDRNLKASIKQQTKYEYEKQQVIDDAEHEKQMAVSVEQEQRQKVISYSIGGGLALVVLFSIFIGNRLQVTRKQKKTIEKQKIEVEFQRDVAEKQKVEIAHQHHQLESTHKEISDSIKYAERLQLAILPSKEEFYKDLQEGFILYQPKSTVSGDFYWMKHVSDTSTLLRQAQDVALTGTVIASKMKQSADKEQIASDSSSHRNDGSIEQSRNVILFAAADCTGHGVPGAMVSVVCSNALDRAVKEFHLTDTGEILDKVTDLVIARFENNGNFNSENTSSDTIKDGMDIGLCAINLQTKTLQYSGANNPLWMIRKRTGNEVFGDKDVFNETHYVVEHKATKQPIGNYAKREPFATVNIELKEDDYLYLFTDGFADQFGGPRGKKFKYKPFKKLLLSVNHLPMKEQGEILKQEFDKWKGDYEQVDDVCIIGTRI